MVWLSLLTVFSKIFTLDFLQSSECASINGIYMLKVTDKNTS